MTDNKMSAPDGSNRGEEFSARPGFPRGAPEDFTVCVIVHDDALRDKLTLALGHRGYCLRHFSSCAAFISARWQACRCCVVSSARFADASGLDLLRLAKEGQSPSGGEGAGAAMPVVLIDCENDAALTRRAFLAGAIDVLPAPLDLDELQAAVERGIKQARQQAAAEMPRVRRTRVLDVLTRREAEVAQLVRQGFDNRSIGNQLAISHRTVEVHKTRLMRKLGIQSLSELIALPMPTPPRKKTHSAAPRSITASEGIPLR